MLLTNERKETANSHTRAHMHTPNWTNWKLSLLWKAVFHVFFAQTTRSVISLVFKFCLCVVCWFQLISDLFWFNSVFTAFVVSTRFRLCHDRARDVYRDPSFLFPKAPKKKGWSSLCSISAECSPWDKVRPMRASLTLRYDSSSSYEKPRKWKWSSENTESLFWMELMSVCVLNH